MGSSAGSDDPALRLGALLTGTEAADIADRLAAGGILSTALRAVDSAHRARIRQLITEIGSEHAVAVLRAIQGARSARPVADPLWTLPGGLARSGRLTSEVRRVVDGARRSVVCSTFNFQRSSALWGALQRASQRPGVAVRVYLDAQAAEGPRTSTPTTAEVAARLSPAAVYRTKEYDGSYVRNHAKFLAIDHRFLLVTSANFSRSAENYNVELGLFLDNPNLTEIVENEFFQVENHIYERVDPGTDDTG
ncbi:DISARM system phospholipase D-like protein DrmC [Nocardia sp. CC227C]|uniref:DISARM system phospholipase D-like protein DrmC n=1 Tax=Nocardia sp. CC227C TaxID=3044562 RepID=UPI00278C4CFE|nr:DISARM system phospholipase D-like protein DrmC [Nocardia sp. CC227C]